jgi:hypothetical protein
MQLQDDFFVRTAVIARHAFSRINCLQSTRVVCMLIGREFNAVQHF